MVSSLLRTARLDGPVSDCSTLCRRQKPLAVPIPYCRADGPLNLLADAPGSSFRAMANGRSQARVAGPPHDRRARARGRRALPPLIPPLRRAQDRVALLGSQKPCEGMQSAQGLAFVGEGRKHRCHRINALLERVLARRDQMWCGATVLAEP